MKYLFIAEDGCLSQADNMPAEASDAVEEGIWDIVDMENGLQYEGDGKWGNILPL